MARARRGRPATCRGPAAGEPRGAPRSGRTSRSGSSTWSPAHRSTIVFANSRRLAERLTARLNEICGRAAGAAGRAAPTAGRRAARAAAGQLMAQAGASRGAAPVLARAHHGSVSKEQRALIEEELKAGRLPAVVATSSASSSASTWAPSTWSSRSSRRRRSPAGCSGSAGPATRSARSRAACVFPKYRGDLVQTAVVVERMRAGRDRGAARARATRSTCWPSRSSRCVALDDVGRSTSCCDAGAPGRAVRRRCRARRSSGARHAGRPLPAATSSPSCGRGSSGTGSPDTLTGRPGAQRLAVTSGGTIPDRGLFGVFLAGGEAAGPRGSASSTRRWSTSRGSATCSPSARRRWRIEDITHDRVLVTPAPGQPGQAAVLEGDALGRPAELGPGGRRVRPRARRARRRRRRAARLRGGRPGRVGRRQPARLPRRAARGHRARARRPHDRGRAVPRRARRLAGGRPLAVRRAGARAVGAGDRGPAAGAVRRRRRRRCTPTTASCCGCPTSSSTTAAAAPTSPSSLVARARRGRATLVTARGRRLGAVRVAVPRVRGPGAAAAAPQTRPAHAAVAAAPAGRPAAGGRQRVRLVPDRARDGARVPAGRLRRARPGRADARHRGAARCGSSRSRRRSRRRSPGRCCSATSRSSSTRATRRWPSAGPPRCARPDAAGRAARRQAELRELLDPDALAEVEPSCSGCADDRRAARRRGRRRPAARARPADHRRGRSPRGADAGRLAGRARGRRAGRSGCGSPARSAGPRSRTPAGCATRSARRCRSGVPEAFLEPVADPLGDLRRPVRPHPRPVHRGRRRRPVRPRRRRGRTARCAGWSRPAGWSRASSGRAAAGHASGATPRCCAGCAAARWPRCAQEVEPVAAGDARPASCRPGRASARTACAALDGAAARGRAAAGRAGAGVGARALVLPARVAGYTPALLDELTAVRRGALGGHGALPGDDGWVSLHLADTAPLTAARRRRAARADARCTRRCSTRWPAAARCSSARSPTRVGPRPSATDDATLRRRALWDLVWAGRLTNDTLAPLRALLGRRPRRPRTGAARPAARPRTAADRPRAGRRRDARPRRPADRGRPVVAAAGARARPDPARRTPLAETLLDRHGVVTRGAVAAERVAGGFAAVYRVLSRSRRPAACRRGYFVEGLGAAQFAVPGAVDRLRRRRRPRDRRRGARAGAACWPPPTRPTRTAPRCRGRTARPRARRRRPPARPQGRRAGGAVDGELVALRRARRPDAAVVHRRARRAAAGGRRAGRSPCAPGELGRLTVERADGAGSSAPATRSAPALEAAGFHATPRGLRLRA